MWGETFDVVAEVGTVYADEVGAKALAGGPCPVPRLVVWVELQTRRLGLVQLKTPWTRIMHCNTHAHKHTHTHTHARTHARTRARTHARTHAQQDGTNVIEIVSV